MHFSSQEEYGLRCLLRLAAAYERNGDAGRAAEARRHAVARHAFAEPAND